MPQIVLIFSRGAGFINWSCSSHIREKLGGVLHTLSDLKRVFRLLNGMLHSMAIPKAAPVADKGSDSCRNYGFLLSRGGAAPNTNRFLSRNTTMKKEKRAILLASL